MDADGIFPREQSTLNLRFELGDYAVDVDGLRNLIYNEIFIF